MFELLSIICTAAALAHGSCLPPSTGAQAAPQEPARPDIYEMRVAPGDWQLSYAGKGHEFDEQRILEFWRRRAALRCGGDYRGHPMVQTQYPEPGYDAMVARWPLSETRTHNVEAFGVAHCVDRTR